MEINIIVPDKIVLKGEQTERTVTLENCHDQNEIIEYIKIYISIRQSESLLSPFLKL